MASNDSAFLIEQQGTWPNETYKITLSSDIIDPRAEKYPAESLYRFIHNPQNETDKLNSALFTNLSYYFSEEDSVYYISLDDNASMIWNVSGSRLDYNLGPQFNYFQVDTSPGKTESYKEHYAYTLYPSRLYNKPLSVVKNSNSTWTLETSAVLTNIATHFFSGRGVENAAYDKHIDFLKNSTLSFKSLPDTTSLNYVFGLSSQNIRVDRNAITFDQEGATAAIDGTKWSNLYNPKSIGLIETPSSTTTQIRPDSTFVEYQIQYYNTLESNIAPTSILSLGHIHRDKYVNAIDSFKSSYILNANSLKTSTQLFQLLQNIPIGTNSDISLDDSRYCVLSAIFDLNKCTFSYKAKQKSRIPYAHGKLDTSVTLDYITYSPYFYNDDTKTKFLVSNASSLSSFKIGNNTLVFNTGVPYSYLSNTAKVTTKYPPHYYTYLLSVSSSTLNKLADSHYLTFNVQTSVLSASTETAVLSTFISSDFGIYNYPLSGFTLDSEKIKFDIVNSKDPIFTLDDDYVKLYYGSGDSYTLYDWKTSPWIKAASASRLTVHYPNNPYGQINILIRPTLSSAFGFLSQKYTTQVTLASALKQQTNGIPISIHLLKETPLTIDASCETLTADPAWPTRDLTNSYIKWSYEPSDVSVDIYNLKTDGTLGDKITRDTEILFSDSSKNVRFTNFGLEPLTISLYSKKYDETTYLKANTSLYDPLTERRFVIGPKTPLNNFDVTRTISLSALVPYNNKLYTCPTGTLLSWMWQYNASKNPEVTPINVYYTDTDTGRLSAYTYGQVLPAGSLSSIYIEITPAYTSISPEINSVKFRLNCNSFKNPFYTEYEFFVDDFPSRDLLNSDFQIWYTGYDSLCAKVLDTSLNQYVLTRPADGTNKFTLSSLNTSDVAPNTTYTWVVSNDKTGSSTSTTTYGKHTKKITIPTNVRTTIVTLCALSAYAVGWDSPNFIGNEDFNVPGFHNVETTVTIYTPSTTDFNSPLEFITYPEYYWNNLYLKLSNTDNYTLAVAPTAFDNKKSNSHNFYISANKSFSEYDYFIGSKKTFFTSLSSASPTLIAIPSSAELASTGGVVLNLTAYSNQYPQYYPISYVKPINNSAGAALATYNYNITSSTVAFGTNVANKFKYNPRIIPYSSNITFSYGVEDISIDLDYVRTIAITQTINTADYNTNPVHAVSGGTITYALSTLYWPNLYYVDVPVVPSYYGEIYRHELVDLNIGDPYETGNITEEFTNYIAIKPFSYNIPVQITSRTFDDYINDVLSDDDPPVTSSSWTGDTDLWNPVSVVSSFPLNQEWVTITATTTSKQPDAYISNFMSLTGKPIFVVYTNPGEKIDNKILYCKTNFGQVEEEYIISKRDEAAYYTYTIPGTYYISYQAIYEDGSTRIGTLPEPIIIKPYWDNIQEAHTIKNLTEENITLPYTLDEIKIQPNEWGDSDIFNTALTRLNACLDELHNNMKAINTDLPSVYFGWLGKNTKNKGLGIRWHSKLFGKEYYTQPVTYSDNSGFNNIKDICQVSDRIFVLDGKNLRVFNNTNYKPSEYTFSNIADLNEILVNPTRLEADSTQSRVFILDKDVHKLYCVDIDYNLKLLNLSLVTGGYGERRDTNKFYNPSDMCIAEDHLFVLDNNNKCVKEFNTNLNWIHTYYSVDFETDSPILVASPFDEMCYVLTAGFKLYVFDITSPTPNIFSLDNLRFNKEKPTKMTFDEIGEFIYIITPKRIFKYNIFGQYAADAASVEESYITDEAIGYTPTSIKKGPLQNLLISTKNAIVKIQDSATIFEIGKGLPKQQWSLDQILLKREEFASDINYNRALNRMAQNIKTLRNSLNFNFAKVFETVITNKVSKNLVYYTMYPTVVEKLPTLPPDVQNESLLIGANEFHIPQVLNRELEKIYNAIVVIRQFLDVSTLTLPNYKVEGSGNSSACSEKFCWSWKKMSHLNLPLPVIKKCGINPITYTELSDKFPINYDPDPNWSKKWNQAYADCCKDTKNPLTL